MTIQPERAGRERAPPLFAAVSARGEGGLLQGLLHTLSPPWGSLPSDLSLREGSEQGSEHRPHAGAKRAAGKRHEDALSGPDRERSFVLRMGFPLPAFPQCPARMRPSI